MVDKIPYYIGIIAALVVTIVGIVLETPLVVLAGWLVFFILLFYFIGIIVRAYLRHTVFFKADTPVTDDAVLDGAATNALGDGDGFNDAFHDAQAPEENTD